MQITRSIFGGYYLRQQEENCLHQNEIYLSPELNPRNINTASNLQAREPINPNSLSGWKNYQELIIVKQLFLSPLKIISNF